MASTTTKSSTPQDSEKVPKTPPKDGTETKPAPVKSSAKGAQPKSAKAEVAFDPSIPAPTPEKPTLNPAATASAPDEGHPSIGDRVSRLEHAVKTQLGVQLPPFLIDERTEPQERQVFADREAEAQRGQLEEQARDKLGKEREQTAKDVEKEKAKK